MTTPPAARSKSHFVLAAACVLSLLGGGGAFAATDTVTNTNDDFSAGSLRSAVSSNSVVNGGDTISFGVGGTFFLNTPLAQISTATLDFSPAASSATIAGAVVSLTSTVVFNVGAQPAGIASAVNNGSVAGTLVKTGAGVLDLFAANGYTGGTILNAGTLQLDNVAALGPGVVTLNGGTLAFNVFGATITNTININPGGGTLDLKGNTGQIAGVITGSGGLTMLSTGTLVLTGANTYTGNTAVTGGGILNINGDAALGTGNSFALTGSTLQFAGSFAMAHPTSLAAGNGATGGTIDTQGFNGVISGVISGAGSLTKVGAGALTLGGAAANTYSGGTVINAGTVILAGNNALGTGAISMANGTVLSLGAFTQSAGNITTNAGTLQMTLNTAAPTTPTLTGATVNLTNSTLQVTLPVTTVKPIGTPYTFTPISGASMTGVPAVSGPALIKFTPIITGGNTLTLTGAVQPLATVAATGNQAAVGNMLLAAQNNPTGAMANVLGQMYSMNAAQVQAALDQINPVSLAAMSGLGMSAAGVQSAAVSRRMSALADGSARQEFAHYSVSPKFQGAGDLLVEPPGDTNGPMRDFEPGSRWGVFSAGVLSAGRVQEATSGAGIQPGYAFNTGGITMGADYRVAENAAVGVALGYLHGHASLYAPAAGTIDNNSFRYGVYALHSQGRFHSDLYVGGASDHFDTNRVISIGAINLTAKGSPSATELNVRPSVSYDQDILDWGTFSPFGVLEYNRMQIRSFTESGADPLNMSVGGQTAESLQSTLGLRYSQKFSEDSRTYVPYGSLGWRHQYDPQSRPLNAQLASGGGSQFSVATGNIARDGTLVGLGLSLDWGKGLVGKLDWAGDFRSHYQDSLFNLSLRYSF